MSYLEEWFRKKLSKEKGSVSIPIEVEGKIQRIYGPRADFAYVYLLIEPADEFDYVCEAEWPEGGDEFNKAVVSGVLDGLISAFPEYWYTNIRVTLKDIKYHPVDSSPRAFYKASRNAIGKLEYEHNNEKGVFRVHQ